jgi:Arm DNA-binding domain
MRGCSSPKVTSSGKPLTSTSALWWQAGAKPEADAAGELPALSIAEARQRASAAAVKAQRGIDPAAERKRKEAKIKKTVSHILDQFIERYAKPNLRSADQYENTFDRLVKPDIGDYSIYEL